jgi:hypothetical protein
MQKVIIVDLASKTPVVKGTLQHDCPAFAVVDVENHNKSFEGSELFQGRQKFNKEFYDAELQKLPRD